MKLYPIDSDREALKKYLQDLICDAGSPQEVNVLVEALNSLEGSAGFGSEEELEKRFRIAHGNAENKAAGKAKLA
ncbi:MAG: hypothetical protein WCD49_18445 [Candidatus Acidiferrales bacterium]